MFGLIQRLFCRSVYDWGQNNKIEIVDENGVRRRVRHLSGSRIIFAGNNNRIVLHQPIGDLTLDVQVTNNVHIDIQHCDMDEPERSFLIKKVIDSNVKNKSTIGKGLRMKECTQIEFAGGAGDITIGNGCMFAAGSLLWAGDFHAIINAKTGTVLNSDRGIVVGNRVWLAAGVRLLKGAAVPDDSVVAMGAIVTKPFVRPGVVLAGVPAVVKKRGIKWDKLSPYEYAQLHNQVGRTKQKVKK